ncbi:Rib/alpha-like domain-containing protein [Corynebacterium aquatimens]|uniref:Long Rib domain-containing protein n=1 Tax=Corynebacterium aquatimens TaxID=1190508 RepID=A0A931DYP1_9CORY|nr:Rib/alpha-like domain-containing protein [Corynebacterium aquatimens]MBG6122822.1 hypothetical protein [Corynebacterium aquatimens]WJY66843.1 hypothetical protein CAQUA_10785 [Corynebacterium aquatimens]
MSKMNTARRRGTTIAAAALSLALVAPVLQPIAAPVALPAAQAAEATTTATSASNLQSRPTQVLEADAYANGYVKSATDLTNAKHTVSGRAYVYRTTSDAQGYDPSLSTTGESRTPVPEGTVVKLQWMDDDGAVSPIYTAKTTNTKGRDSDPKNVTSNFSPSGPGAYAFDLREGFVDANGRKHIYNATGGQMVKIWIDPYKDPMTGNMQNMLRVAPGGTPGTFGAAGGLLWNNLGSFPFAGQNLQRTAIWMNEVPEPRNDGSNYMTKPRKQWIEDNAGPLKRLAGGEISSPKYQTPKQPIEYTVSGQVWREIDFGQGVSKSAVGNEVTQTFDPYDAKIADGKYSVVLTMLTEEAAQSYKVAMNGTNPAKRAEATKKWLEDYRAKGQDPIVATVKAPVIGSHYTARFPKEAFDKTNANSIYGFLVDENEQIVTSYSTYNNAEYAYPRRNRMLNPKNGSLQAPTDITSLREPFLQGNNRWINVNFAAPITNEARIDILEYDVFNNPAPHGTPLEVRVDGELSNMRNRIVWTKNNQRSDDDATKIEDTALQVCEIETVEDAKKCTFTAWDLDGDKKVNDGDVLTATLYFDNYPISRDSVVVLGDKQNSQYQPSYPHTQIPKGESREIKPTWTDGKGNPINPPVDSEGNGPTFELEPGVTGIPESITVAPDGTVVVTGETPVGKYQIPVVVTYPDGSREIVTAKVDVVNGSDATNTTPRWDNTSTPAGEPVKVPNTGDPIPAGSTVEVTSDKNWTVTTTPEGVVTVTPPADAKTGDKSTITVTVTYPDGSVDVEKFTVTVDNKDGGDNAATTTPNWDNQETTPGEPVKVPNTGDPLPEGTKVTPTIPNNPGGWTVDVDGDGTITVTPPKDSQVGDKIEVEVDVTYPDGSKDKETFTVTVVDVVDVYTVGYPNTKVKVGESETASPVFSTNPKEKNFTEVPGAKNDHDGLWSVGKPGVRDGKVKATAPNQDKLAKAFTDTRDRIVKGQCEPGKVAPEDIKRIIEEIKKLFSAGTAVDVTFEAGATPSKNVPVRFTLVDANGKPLADSDDWDGDGKSNEDEIRDCENPLNPSDQKAPDWNDTSTTPGQPVVVENTGGPVKPGTTVEISDPTKGKVEIDPTTGDITFVPSDDLKPGDKVTVVVKDPEGNKIDEFTIEIVAENPDWNDAETQPNKPVEVKNEGGPVRPGTTVKVTDPTKGTATIDPNSGDITFTPSPNMEPDDVAFIVVTGPDDKEIDTFHVTVVVSEPYWNDASTPADKPVTIPNEGGPTKPGTTVTVEGGEGKGTAKIDDNGNITFTPGDNAKPGDKITVTVKDPSGNIIDTITVTVKDPTKVVEPPIYNSGTDTTTVTTTVEKWTGLSSHLPDRDHCIATLASFGIPLALLIPVGIVAAAGLPGLQPMMDQVSVQIKQANTNLQQSLGVFNPEVARVAAQIDAQLAPVGLNLAQAAIGLALLAAGIAAIVSVYKACVDPNGVQVLSSTGSSGRGAGKGSDKKKSTSPTTTSTTSAATEPKPSEPTSTKSKPSEPTTTESTSTEPTSTESTTTAPTTTPESN